MDAGVKRAAPVGASAAAAKRAKESVSSQMGVGSKLKPCTKFFSLPYPLSPLPPRWLGVVVPSCLCAVVDCLCVATKP
ncbi:hypothetical protein GUJ93_ZPchr0012g21238 [Zizania palustris]|uniref:Uncharacterized protein n=1 Tax=Zizania palustris TaxID=103762 RepID=A0A8J6BSG4_ZIZPA|nr:hypothetical protein GUJ93_ZPchr0012g21238 [Zizania palustris]